MIASLGMLVIAVIVVVFASLASFETKIGVNHAHEVRAVQAAEGGARRVFREMVNAPNSATWWLTQTQPIHTGVAAGDDATYTVRVEDNNDGDGTLLADADGIVIIRSTGSAGGTAGVGHARLAVGLMVSPRDFVPLEAVRVANALTVSGNPTILGRCGSVHVPVAPGFTGGINVDTAGDAVCEQGMSTSGTSVAGDYYHGPTPTGSQVPPETEVFTRPVPPIDPTQFGKYADYLLLDNGWAYSWAPGAVDPGTLTPCTSAPCVRPDPAGWIKHFSDADPTKSTKDSGKCSFGWKMVSEVSSSGPARWDLCGPGETGFMTPGTVYVLGSATVSHDVGSSATPYRITLITTASIEVSGNPTLAPDNGVGPNTANPFAANTLVVAGRDAKFNGNPASAGFTGMIAAHEQLDISGNGVFNSFFLSENANQGITSWPSGDGLVAFSNISGNPSITFNCGMVPAELQQPTIFAWMDR